MHSWLPRLKPAHGRSGMDPERVWLPVKTRPATDKASPV